MSIDKLKKYLEKDRISIEEKVDADQILLDLSQQLDDIEVYVVEPDDIDDEAVQVYTKAQLNKMKENAVVAIANDLDLDASAKDKKADTIQKILDFQKT